MHPPAMSMRMADRKLFINPMVRRMRRYEKLAPCLQPSSLKD